MSGRPIIDAVVEAGLVPDTALDELARWGVHITAQRKPELDNPQAVALHLMQALESDEQVRVDETDLDLLQRYLNPKHQLQGRLIIKEGKSHTTAPISFCLTSLGEYAIPWTDDETPEVLANGESHLKWDSAEGKKDIYFSGVREVFFGSRKAFVVCTPSTLEEK
jgi:hypothetical protein